MCDMVVAPVLAAFGGGGAATAAGATAAAATTAGTGFNLLQTIGLLTGLAGTAIQTRATSQALDEQERLLVQQQETERQLNAVEDQRTRARMGSELAQQRGELVARNIDLSSPTAVHLGVTAARELSFASQAVRSEGRARDIELSANRRVLQGRRITARARGIVTAADRVLTAAPNIWPELLA